MATKKTADKKPVDKKTADKKPADKQKSKSLVIVESPAKAKTLKKFLGSGFTIEASMGHVRDLPKSELGIDPATDFEPKYITIRGKGELLAKLRKAARDADKIYLATDPDREGEAISWHLIHALKLDTSKTERITFNEITKTAVKRSIKEAREVAMPLVDAQQARRLLDRVVGYKISPLLWKKVKKGLSAGRVQSVALRIICDREAEVKSFIPEEYWTLEAKLQAGKSAAFTARYHNTDGATELKTQADTDAVLADVRDNPFTIQEIKRGQRMKKPLPPFTTSTLQQEASKAFNFAASKTMLLAQQLYEGIDVKGHGTVGLVSYIRTDSVRISDEAFTDAQSFIRDKYGADYATDVKPEYKQRGRAQDAHEAIRPTYTIITPAEAKESLSRDQYRLYNLIWERFIASNMTPAVFDTMSVRLKNGAHEFRASGSVIRFDGYKKVYVKDEEDAADSAAMPELSEKDKLKTVSLHPEQHFTQAPARYTEALLVKTMEENGVGRPSTYAPTISTIVNRGYVMKENKVFYPTELGEIVNEIMVENFAYIFNIDFTAQMEENLDEVEDGTADWKDIIRRFYGPLMEKIEEAEERIGEIEIKPEETDIPCEFCGRMMVVKLGRYGKFLACPGFPACKNARPFFEDAGVNCPLCGGKVLVKKTKKGRKYYGCEGAPACAFMSWLKPTGGVCPRCGQPLVMKGAQKKKICCVGEQCGYTEEMAEENE